MNRRGTVLDVFVIMLIVFTLAIGVMFSVFVMKNFTGALLQSPLNSTVPSSTIVSNVDSSTPWVMDFFCVMIMFGLPLLAMILAFFNNISPIWFWSMFGFTMLIIIVAGWFATGYDNFVNTPGGISVMKNYMPMTDFVMHNFILYAIVVTLIIGFGIYAKTRDQQRVGGSSI